MQNLSALSHFYIIIFLCAFILFLISLSSTSFHALVLTDRFFGSSTLHANCTDDLPKLILFPTNQNDQQTMTINIPVIPLYSTLQLALRRCGVGCVGKCYFRK